MIGEEFDFPLKYDDIKVVKGGDDGSFSIVDQLCCVSDSFAEENPMGFSFPFLPLWQSVAPIA